MTRNDTGESSGIEMSDDEIEAFLYEQGDGVLSFAKDGTAYGVPISFGYDGDRIFLQLVQFGEESEKSDFVDETDSVCLTAYTTETRFEWQSILARGTLSDVPSEDVEYMESVMDENAGKVRLSPMEESLEGVRRVELDVTEVTGRRRTSMSS